MKFQNFLTLSLEVRAQIGCVADLWHRHLGDALVGVYVHGSIALGRFVEGVSDLDMLIVVDRPIGREERLNIAADILAADERPAPLELSALWTEQLTPWRYPTLCQFHYSGAWTEHYRSLLDESITESFLVDTDFPDPDIACHVRLTSQLGICVYGRPVAEVFPEVPEDDFWQSISADVPEYDFHAYAPKYYASNILVLGRILSYRVERRILSKYDAGLWMLERIPEGWRYIVENALNVWYDGGVQLTYRPEDEDGLRRWLIDAIMK
ncbi:MAG: DUF4111 domain-containing protein [Clostridia bacterium]|nr:DUF4111 domain-containing protein [Clostridia bacterium]